MAVSGRAHRISRIWSVDELCHRHHLTLVAGDKNSNIAFVASPAHAKNNTLVLVMNSSFIDLLAGRDQLVCLTSPDFQDEARDKLGHSVILVSDQPKRTFAKILTRFFPPPAHQPGIDSTARIDPTAKIDPTAHIGPFVVIGPHCSIGPHCAIGASAVLSEQVTLGDSCLIGAHVCLSFLQAGFRVKIASHAVIGKRGFGFEGQGPEIQLTPHLGAVIMGSDCDIGAGVIIDRGVIDNTVINDYVMIDNQCHIAHNVQIGEGTIILAQTAIAGSAVIGQNCVFGGQVGVKDHVTITDNSVFTSKSGVTKDIHKDGIYAGFPAIPSREYWKQVAAVQRLCTPKKITKKSANEEF